MDMEREPCASASSGGAKLPPPPPSVAADACLRPAAPFALSMLAAGDSGSGANCGKFALPGVVLRKVAPQPIFAVRAWSGGESVRTGDM